MEVIQCKCGCGTELTKHDKYGRIRSYISGHNGKKYDDPNEYRKKWVRNNRESVNKARQKRHRKRKIKLIQLYTDGKCKKCNIKYDGTNGSIFQFHHMNPENKLFAISTGYEKTFKLLCEEVQKCELYCGNCHLLLHLGEY